MSRRPGLYQWIDTVVMRFSVARQTAGFGSGIAELRSKLSDKEIYGV